ncbi:MAG: ECF transporter S component [Promethearchaeota archaeon]
MSITAETVETRGKNFRGYFFPASSVSVAITAIFTALCTVLTVFLYLPIPQTTGYVNVGEVGVMLTALLFGPIVGGIAGGVGSAISDLIVAPQFAPVTLLVKGLEGFLVGLIADPRKMRERIHWRQFLAVVVGGTVMVMGYFTYEAAVFGLGAALAEMPWNFFQMSMGLVAIGLTAGMRQSLVRSFPSVFAKIYVPAPDVEKEEAH